jgi:hypothetical protein
VPALSDDDLPRTWRPRGPRIAALVFGVVLVGGFAWLWISFDDQTREAVSGLQRATVIFFLGVGLAALNGLARSRVTASVDGLELVNGYRTRRLEWAQVVRVSMPAGAPWPTVPAPGPRSRS